MNISNSLAHRMLNLVLKPQLSENSISAVDDGSNKSPPYFNDSFITPEDLGLKPVVHSNSNFTITIIYCGYCTRLVQ